MGNHSVEAHDSGLTLIMTDHAHTCLKYTEKAELTPHLEVMTSESGGDAMAVSEESMENAVNVLLEFGIKEVHVSFLCVWRTSSGRRTMCSDS